MKYLLTLVAILLNVNLVLAVCDEDDSYQGCPTVSTVTVETDEVVWKQFEPVRRTQYNVVTFLFRAEQLESYVYDLERTTDVVVVAQVKPDGERSEPIIFLRKYIKEYHEIKWMGFHDNDFQIGYRKDGMVVWRNRKRE